ncbi:MAG TPA: glutamyl-tRNA reductase [Flavobacteriales bacterium]|nr:glutamyl-tRNA reductase [Flavobacteriales bacterium]
MDHFKVIAITHRLNGLNEVGKFHISDEDQSKRLHHLKSAAKLDELMYLSTCNRVEFYFVTKEALDDEFLVGFYMAFNPQWTETQLHAAVKSSEHYVGEEAIKHVFNVASSLDSMVVGEREIITQVRSAFEKSKDMGLTGDGIRLVVKKTIETAKEIYSKTNIATKPVSVVSLAFKRLEEYNVKNDARILFIGAGQTNTNMARFLKKYGYTNFVVFNRSVANGLSLAAELKCDSKELAEIMEYKKGFDVLITCTASSEYIITPEVYTSLLNGETDLKFIIDLAIPTDVDPVILKNNKTKYISVDYLKTVAESNLREREKEMVHCHKMIDEHFSEFKDVFKIRQIERAMCEVPQKIKEIREMAMNSIFAKDIANMDENSREVLQKVVEYMEKKYISVPMKMAKEIIIETAANEKLVEQPVGLN